MATVKRKKFTGSSGVGLRKVKARDDQSVKFRFGGENMSPMFVPRFSSTQREEPQPGQNLDHRLYDGLNMADIPSSRHKEKRAKWNKCGKQRDDGGVKAPITLKLPKLSNLTSAKKATEEEKVEESQRSRMLEANKTKTRASRGGETQCAGPDSESVGGDVFSFSQRTPNEKVDEKEKAKLAVIRTISKMLEENQLIRKRLAALRETN